MSDSKALTTTNGQEIQRAQLGEMSVQAIIDRKRKIVEVMEAVMTEGVHYGRIPGCGDKPTLFKPGAEILATVFGLAPTFKINERELPNGHREYQITCTLTHIGSGKSLGEGVGTCSTMESKYRWRTAQRLCPQCSQPTVLKSKDGSGYFCWAKKGGCGSKWPLGAPEIEKQEIGRAENPDIADTYNTVLKMAKKRAQVDCTLTATGASDILTQDLEDLPQGSREDNHSAVDAEYVEHRADPRDDRPPPSEPRNEIRKTTTADDSDLDIIEKTRTVAELNQLLDTLRRMPEPKKTRAKNRWEAHRELIKSATTSERRAS